MNKDKNAASFWDRVARRYAAMPMRNPDTYEATLERIRAHLKPTDRVLELGCGTGSTALRLAPLVAQYTAVDFSAEMIAIAREKQAEGEVANLDFVVVTVADGSFPDGPFDAILAFNVLHLLPDRDTAFADTFGRLRTGGLFISKTPCLGGVYRVLQPVVAILRLFGKAPRLAFLTPRSLEREITQAGFEIREHGNYPARPPSRFIVAAKH
jgi:ubiquinone/menaquinone biosynthesis C-methylase UbiE